MGFRDPALAGRLGGLSRSARYDGQTVTREARSSFAESFLMGHQCRVCPPISVPIDLPLEERERRAAALRKAHYVRIASLPRGSRAKAREAATDG
jgi:hypothetical protein